MPSEAPPAVPAPALPATFLASMALRLGTVAVNAITGIVTARALSPTGRGELAAMVLWPMLFAGLTTIGQPAAVVYHIRREPQRAGVYVGWALAVSAAAAVVGTAIGWPLIPHWLRHHPPEVVRAAQWCLATTTLCALTLTGRAAWEAHGRFVSSAISQLVTPVCVLAGLAVLLGQEAMTAQRAAAVYVLAGLPSLVWILAAVAARRHVSLGGGRAVWTRLSHYGIRSYGVDLCGILAIYLDQALVVGLLSAASMGIYAVALSLSRVIGAVHAAVAAIVFPRAVGLAPDDLAAAIGRAGRLGTLVAGVLGSAVLVAGPALLAALYGPAYAPAAGILPILVAEALVAGLTQVLLQGFLAAGRPGVATSVLGVALAGSVPLFLGLVPAFGVVGAAWALLGGSTLRLIATLAAYRAMRHPVPRVLPTIDDLADLARYRGVLHLRSRLGAAGDVE